MELETEKIKVSLLFFGAARDVTGYEETEVFLSSPINVSGAFEEVMGKYPALRDRFGRSLLFAVNQEYAPTEQEISEGDELAIFPPVSGGEGSK